MEAGKSVRRMVIQPGWQRWGKQNLRGAEIFIVFVCMFDGENGTKLHFNFKRPGGVFR